MIKLLERLGIQGTYINIIKAVYRKTIASITINGEKNQSISTKIRNKTKLSPLHLYSVQYLKS